MIIRPITSTSFSRHSSTSAAIPTSSCGQTPQHLIQLKDVPDESFAKCFYSTDLLLALNITASLKHFGKEDVEALLDGQKDEACHHGAQIIDDIINTLVSKAEDVQEGHDVTLTLCQDLLQERLLEEAPCEPGQSPIHQWLQIEADQLIFGD